MIIAISGSVGSGKTSLAFELKKSLGGFELVHLNDLALEYKICNVSSLQTFDFDLDALLDKLERDLKNGVGVFAGKNIILEGHFSHFISSNLIDLLFVVNRDLKELKKEYEKRGYNEQKIVDNLEVESFNLCFYEAEEEGYDESKLVSLNNDLSILKLRDRVICILRERGFLKDGE